MATTETKKEEPKGDEAPDEWTVLAQSYTSALVPAFAPIYKALGDRIVTTGGGSVQKLLDFGCGPGEPCLTLCDRYSFANVVGVDSTPAMLEIAIERGAAKEVLSVDTKAKKNKAKNLSFVHIRRDCTMADLKEAVGGGGGGGDADLFDVVTSAFVFHYLPFERRVEILTTLLELAPTVILVTWGDQSRVNFLRALKTFGTWKSANTKNDDDPKKRKDSIDICTVTVKDEDDGKPDSPRGSFTMAREETFHAMKQDMEKNKQGEEYKMTFECRSIPLVFPNAAALLSFLPFPSSQDDSAAMMKLLNHWKETDSSITIGSDDDEAGDELKFDTDIIFCKFERSS